MEVQGNIWNIWRCMLQTGLQMSRHRHRNLPRGGHQRRTQLCQWIQCRPRRTRGSWISCGFSSFPSISRLTLWKQHRMPSLTLPFSHLCCRKPADTDQEVEVFSRLLTASQFATVDLTVVRTWWSSQRRKSHTKGILNSHHESSILFWGCPTVPYGSLHIHQFATVELTLVWAKWRESHGCKYSLSHTCSTEGIPNSHGIPILSRQRSKNTYYFKGLPTFLN